MKSLNKYLTSWFSKAPALGAVALVFSGSSVNALPGNIGENNFRQLLQIISQNNDEPPEVIIDDNSGSVPPPPTRNSNSDTRFTCELVNGEYTVMYYPESQPDRGYPWAIPSQLGGGWTPEKRCDAITNRFEAYRQDGLLELTTGVENNYDIICVTTQVDPTDCRIVLTVPPGQDPQLTRDLIFENLLIADDGQQTQGVYTFDDERSANGVLNEVGNVLGVEGLGGNGKRPNRKTSNAIDLRPFLDPADGGTGRLLTEKRSVNQTPSNSPSTGERKPAIFK